MTIKLKKDGSSHPCIILLEWFHNHPLQLLQVNSLKEILLETVAETVKDYFDQGYDCFFLLSRLLIMKKSIDFYYDILFTSWSY